MVMRLCSVSARWYRYSDARNHVDKILFTKKPFLRVPLRICIASSGRHLKSSVYNAPSLSEDDIPTVRDIQEASIEVNEAEKDEENEASKPSFWGRVKGWFKMDRKRLQDLGIGAFIAYSFVSNVNYGIFFTIAWMNHVKQTGMIPFAKGQWKAFMAVYAGLWAIQNIMRPVRIAAAIALTPLVNRMLDYLVINLGIRRRQAVMLLFLGLAVFTLSSLISGIWILGGIPAKVSN